MRIFFWNKRDAFQFTVLAVLFLAIGVGAFGIINSNSPGADFAEAIAPIRMGDSGKKTVALTFNVDWGEEYLSDLLQILEESEIKATFFLTGRWAQQNPELSKRISDEGHEIGNHGYSHANPGNLDRAENRREIERTSSVLKELTGVDTSLFAPPYGETPEHVLAAAKDTGHKTVLWTVDTIDWQENRTVNEIIAKVENESKSGAIILMHPTQVTCEALPLIITYFRNGGYRMDTVSNIL